MYGERWKDWQPLNEVERADILRAEVGYALGEDALGLERFREKYAAKMAGTPDAHAFQIASAPLGASGADLQQSLTPLPHPIRRTFLRDMQSRYPDASPPASPALDAGPAVSSGAPAPGQAPGALPRSRQVPFLPRAPRTFRSTLVPAIDAGLLAHWPSCTLLLADAEW